MNDSEVEKTIRNYLPQVAHMSLGTCRDGKPWVCEVHFAYDDKLHLYFCSSPVRRHSQEIADNPRVAGNIVTQHFLEQKVRGVYFEGTAQQLQDVDESHTAYRTLHERNGLGPEVLSDARKPDGHKFYKITVSDYYLFDSYTSSPSQKYHLAWGAGQTTPVA